MLTGEDIICFSSIDWDFNWQGHQEIMTRFAAAGNRVLFVENTGVRTPSLKDYRRLVRRLHNWWNSYRGFRQQGRNLYVFSPLLIPFPHSRIARLFNRFVFTRQLNSWCRSQRFNNPVVISFLPSALTLEVINRLPRKLLLYYCIDSFAHSSPQAGKIADSEKRMIREADLVFVTSHQLEDHCQPGNPNVHRFPFTVDYEPFERVREDSGWSPPEELAGIASPRVCYVGGLHRWLDQELLAEAARMLPEVNFVLIGPEQENIDRLRGRANVHLLGARPHDQLPRYLRAMDLGLIPYRITPYTANVFPTKLNEYLAMGLPVVSTAIEEIIFFRQAHPDLVTVARDPEEFIGCIREKLKAAGSRREAELRRERAEIARASGWSVRLEQMSQLIAQAIERSKTDEDKSWRDKLAGLTAGYRRRVAVFAIELLLVYTVFFHTALVFWAGRPLVAQNDPVPSDVILVFGGGVGESGAPGHSTFERAGFAARLYRQRTAGWLVFSSGYQQLSRSDAEDMLKVAAAEGVPQSRIIIEDTAANNYENVTRCLAIMSQRGYRSAVVVTGRYNTRRTRLIFDSLLEEGRAPGVTPDSIRIVPPSESIFFYEDSDRLDQWKAVFHEYAAILYYWWLDRI